MNQRILVVDDEADVAVGFRRVFERDRIDFLAAGSGEEAVAAVRREKPDLVMLDLRLGGIDGIETLRRIRAANPRQLVVLMTAYSTSANVIEAMKHGACEFLMKPFAVDKLRAVVHEALAVARAAREANDTPQPSSPADDAGPIVGVSEAMQRVYKIIGQVARSRATVLITGESGTGKELVARAIHAHSERAPRPFVAVNCAAIPEPLLESELFGHEKGAFTNALARRPGKFEAAHGGTLFLDEIGDMPATTQTKILRVLQDGTFERVGGNEPVTVDVRVLAATNRDLEAMIADGRFREDLYYRLNVVRAEMPPLRERREDIPPLAELMLRRHLRDRPGFTPRLSPAALDKLLAHDWPGNVRELENVLRNAVLTARTETILPADLRLRGERTQPSAEPQAPHSSGPGPIDNAPAPADIDQLLAPLFSRIVAARTTGDDLSAFDVVERALLSQALRETNGNQLRAAALLGITRSTLRKRIARYGIELTTKVKMKE